MLHRSGDDLGTVMITTHLLGTLAVAPCVA
jgi:hypothetical protein